jgi:hypothetical protein
LQSITHVMNCAETISLWTDRLPVQIVILKFAVCCCWCWNWCPKSEVNLQFLSSTVIRPFDIHYLGGNRVMNVGGGIKNDISCQKSSIYFPLVLHWYVSCIFNHTEIISERLIWLLGLPDTQKWRHLLIVRPQSCVCIPSTAYYFLRLLREKLIQPLVNCCMKVTSPMESSIPVTFQSSSGVCVYL